MSLANEYTAHRSPVGSGLLSATGDDDIGEEYTLSGSGQSQAPYGGGLETVEERSVTSNSDRALPGTTDTTATRIGSSVSGSGASGRSALSGTAGSSWSNEGNRWGFVGIWERGLMSQGPAGGRSGMSERRSIARGIPQVGVSSVEARGVGWRREGLV